MGGIFWNFEQSSETLSKSFYVHQRLFWVCMLYQNLKALLTFILWTIPFGFKTTPKSLQSKESELLFCLVSKLTKYDVQSPPKKENKTTKNEYLLWTLFFFTFKLNLPKNAQGTLMFFVCQFSLVYQHSLFLLSHDGSIKTRMMINKWALDHQIALGVFLGKCISTGEKKGEKRHVSVVKEAFSTKRRKLVELCLFKSNFSFCELKKFRKVFLCYMAGSERNKSIAFLKTIVPEIIK